MIVACIKIQGSHVWVPAQTSTGNRIWMSKCIRHESYAGQQCCPTPMPTRPRRLHCHGALSHSLFTLFDKYISSGLKSNFIQMIIKLKSVKWNCVKFENNLIVVANNSQFHCWNSLFKLNKIVFWQKQVHFSVIELRCWLLNFWDNYCKYDRNNCYVHFWFALLGDFQWEIFVVWKTINKTE